MRILMYLARICWRGDWMARRWERKANSGDPVREAEVLREVMETLRDLEKRTAQ